MPEESLVIETFEQLLQNERKIVDRINAMPKGGNLFMAHPFLLLEELGVRLSDDAVAQIIDYDPSLASLSPAPYNALKESRTDQPIRYHLRGLFRRTRETRRDEG